MAKTVSFVRNKELVSQEPALLVGKRPPVPLPNPFQPFGEKAQSFGVVAESVGVGILVAANGMVTVCAAVVAEFGQLIPTVTFAAPRVIVAAFVILIGSLTKG
jgi:hypothetical protein